jgi:S1-C subfamily serine protease
LGVQVKEISKKMLRNLGIDYGLEVIRVYNGSPAEEAGLEKEDILLTFKDEPLYDIDELINMVQSSDLDEINETLREEIEIKSDELKEQMKELREKLKEIKSDVGKANSQFI